MRYFEIVGGIQLPVTADEHEMLMMAEKTGSISVKDLDERMKEIARIMIRRGLFLPVNRDGEELLTPNADPNLWRI
jgi:hypothetical protein